MKKAREYYERVKHKDDWGVDVVYPAAIENIIELAENEGILLGLHICKELWAQGTISHENIRENEIYYTELLQATLKQLYPDASETT